MPQIVKFTDLMSQIDHSAQILTSIIEGSSGKLRISDDYTFRDVRSIIHRLSKDKDMMSKNYQIMAPQPFHGINDMM